MAKHYIEFVRRIYDASITSAGLEKCKQMAEQACYRYMNFNGDIYYFTDNMEWIQLKDMKIRDFEV